MSELDERIERAKVELWRKWNDALGERKEMGVVALVRLGVMRDQECEGVWREFDERWGGRPVVVAGLGPS